MRKALFWLGAGLGAAVMYLLDPQAGRRRRALARDQLIHMMHRSESLSGMARHLSNRAQGIAHEARSMIHDEEVDDVVLVERVRSTLGRVVSYPGAIEVTASGGRVILSGPVPVDEIDALTSAVAGVRGVKEVENRLTARQQPDDTSSREAAA